MEFTVNTKLDLSGLDKIKEACKALSKTVEVGILNNPKEAAIGTIQHFGGFGLTWNGPYKGEIGYFYYGPFKGEPAVIPPRPFIAAPVEHFGGKILTMSAKEYFDFTPKGAAKTLMVAGDTMVKDIQYWMDNSMVYGYPNGWRTILTKGFNHPLIDKGTLRSSIEYEVEK